MYSPLKVLLLATLLLGSYAHAEDTLDSIMSQLDMANKKRQGAFAPTRSAPNPADKSPAGSAPRATETPTTASQTNTNNNSDTHSNTNNNSYGYSTPAPQPQSSTGTSGNGSSASGAGAPGGNEGSSGGSSNMWGL